VFCWLSCSFVGREEMKTTVTYRGTVCVVWEKEYCTLFHPGKSCSTVVDVYSIMASAVAESSMSGLATNPWACCVVVLAKNLASVQWLCANCIQSYFCDFRETIFIFFLSHYVINWVWSVPIYTLKLYFYTGYACTTCMLIINSKPVVCPEGL